MHLSDNLLKLRAADLITPEERTELTQDEVPLAQLVALSDRLRISLDRLVRVPWHPLPPPESLRLLVLDVDGVMTDGGMYYTEQGDEIKKFNAKDGMAIGRLLGRGVEVAFLSSGFTQQIIPARAHTLGVQRVYVGRDPKIDVLQQWCTELNIPLEAVAYVGDDLNDLAVMEAVGLAACPADAVRPVRDRARVVLTTPGGGGCVREFVDRVWKVDE